MTDLVPCPLRPCRGTLRQDPQTGEMDCDTCGDCTRSAEETGQGCFQVLCVLAAVWCAVWLCVAIAGGLTS